MSNTRKEQRKDEEISTATQSTSVTTAVSNVSQVQQEQQHSVNRALDETKNNIRRATDEARKDIPRYTQAANEYQEPTIQTDREIAWVPAIEKTYGAFWNYWTSPRLTTDIYARTVSRIADNTIAAARLVNNNVFSNLDAFKTCVQNARDNLKEVSRIGVNTAKTFEQTSRDTTTRSVSF
jgi:hypothetical protein